jgi:gas vesicle protein
MMNSMNFFRGMGVGIAVGTAIGIACMPKKHHPMKKKAQHTMQLISDCVDDFSHMIGR